MVNCTLRDITIEQTPAFREQTIRWKGGTTASTVASYHADICKLIGDLLIGDLLIGDLG